ncbi:SoxR reducing system RseC family protein [Kangiella marina]|uniref:SoxR reducing system RseC family protein n=1 Tax=Kangiella marina TaxID=1079178 RepID=A0ABP8IMP0_9GAMM
MAEDSMFIEVGQVIAAEGETVWVQTQSKTGCSSCKVSSTCGSGIVNKAFSHKVFVTPLKNTLNAHINDEVEVGIPEDLVLKASLVVYLLPLICLILALATSSVILPDLTELGSIISAVIGLAVGFIGVRWFASRQSAQQQLEPVLLKIVKRPIEVTQVVTSTD